MEEGTKGSGRRRDTGRSSRTRARRDFHRRSPIAELVQEISLASKQQVRGTEGVAHAMQIISNITRQTSQGTRGTWRRSASFVKLSDQLNEALAQFRAINKQATAMLLRKYRAARPGSRSAVAVDDFCSGQRRGRNVET